MRKGTKYSNLHWQQKRDLINKALETPVLRKTGSLNVVKTLAQVGLTKSWAICEIAKAFAKERGIPTSGRSAKQAMNRPGMPFGPETAKLDLKDMRRPCIYEIVCGPTGRRYICSSKRPDLRRSVHLYWLKNIDKEGPSNVFFGNDELARDIIDHGVESFYLEIVEFLPEGLTKGETLRLEFEYMAKVPEHTIYNTIKTMAQFRDASVRKSLKCRKMYNPAWLEAHRQWKAASARLKTVKDNKEHRAMSRDVRRLRDFKNSLPEKVPHYLSGKLS